jgi:tungstate transport system substrate-binding protein
MTDNIPLEGRRSKKDIVIPILVIVTIIVLIGTALVYTSGLFNEEDVLLLATTTSTANSGLLDEIMPDFEEEYHCVVKITPVGTGQALEMGRRGDADILLVHAPSSEIEFVEQGYGTERTQVMYNEFVIVGPPSDHAGIKGMKNTTTALNLIHNSETKFASRGDDSGTHKKETSLWSEAGFDYSSQIDIPDNNWYISVSAGMGDTLTRANELEACTLTDEGTFFSYESDLDLEIMVKGTSSLINQYSIIPINPDKHPHVNSDLAEEFVDWLVSVHVQEKIGDFEANGKTLFTPNAGTVDDGPR